MTTAYLRRASIALAVIVLLHASGCAEYARPDLGASYAASSSGYTVDVSATQSPATMSTPQSAWAYVPAPPYAVTPTYGMPWTPPPPRNDHRTRNIVLGVTIPLAALTLITLAVAASAQANAPPPSSSGSGGYYGCGCIW